MTTDTSTKPYTLADVQALRDLTIPVGGIDLGTTDPMLVDQGMISRFAEVTGDDQWIHVDVERALAESPFGGPIAHGYLTLSLSPKLLPELFSIEQAAGGVNYGAGKVRFPAPVPVDSQVSMSAKLTETTEKSGGILTTFELTFTVESSEKPVCVAEVNYLFL